MSTDVSSGQLASYPPKPVDVQGIERELSELWAQPRDAEQSVTRACMSNLMIFCSDPSQVAVLAEEVAQIVQQHPSRVLLLVGNSNDPASDLEAYVAAHCHLSGGRKQICSEHVTVSAGARALRRLPSVARPLLIGDLPTGLWWTPREAPPLGGDLFRELASMADQVLYDSTGWPDPIRGLMAVADWVLGKANEQAVSDLAWWRLKHWRRLIGQSLDPAVEPGALGSIHQVIVEHRPHALPQACLLVGWLASRLAWQLERGSVVPGESLSWQFRASAGPVAVSVRRLAEGEPDLQSVTIGWKAGNKPEAARFFVSGPGRLGFTREASSLPVRSVAAPIPSRPAILARQLPELRRDLLFRDTLEGCRTMARAVAQ